MTRNAGREQAIDAAEVALAGKVNLAPELARADWWDPLGERLAASWSRCSWFSDRDPRSRPVRIVSSSRHDGDHYWRQHYAMKSSLSLLLIDATGFPHPNRWLVSMPAHF